MMPGLVAFAFLVWPFAPHDYNRQSDAPEPKKPDRREAHALPGEIENTLGMKLVLIPKGKFKMGSPGTEQGREPFDKGSEQQHDVEITRDFYLGKFEVTKDEFAQFVRDSGYKTEAEKDGEGGDGYNATTGQLERWNPRYTWRNTGWQIDGAPVVNVSWSDVVAFCKWLSVKEGKSYRLPTEAEWEYACRAGTTTCFHSGGDPETLATVGNIADASAKRRFPNWPATIKADDGYVFLAPVGRFKPNPFKLHDMHGNVWEWCQDWYAKDYYQNSPREDPQGPSAGVTRVLRGGSWNNVPDDCRAAFRLHGRPSIRRDCIGFRVVLVR